MKNADKNSLNLLMSTQRKAKMSGITSASFSMRGSANLNTAKGSRVVSNSYELKYSFNDYEINDSPNLTKAIKVPQKQIQVQDTINGQIKYYRPPDILIEENS